MQTRFALGGLKIASHLTEVFDEYSTYHREKGLLVKVKDDLLSAIRTGIMMRRYATAVPIGSGSVKPRQKPRQAEGCEGPYFGID